MVIDKIQEKIRDVISDKDLVRLLNLIIEDHGNSYTMFGKYRITANNRMWSVEGTAIQRSLKFCSLKSATAYCIFHSAVNVRESDSLEILDTRLNGQESNLEYYNKLLKKYPHSSQAGIYAAKKRECELNIRLLKQQIAGFHARSRDLQLKKFRAHQINTI